MIELLGISFLHIGMSITSYIFTYEFVVSTHLFLLNWIKEGMGCVLSGSLSHKASRYRKCFVFSKYHKYNINKCYVTGGKYNLKIIKNAQLLIRLLYVFYIYQTKVTKWIN